MTRRRHTPDQIIRKLAEGNELLAGGAELDSVCRQLQIAESTCELQRPGIGPDQIVKGSNLHSASMQPFCDDDARIVHQVTLVGVLMRFDLDSEMCPTLQR